MHIVILTFDGFNELDSLIALGILNRINRPDWRVSIACPTPRVVSMNGVALEAQASLADVAGADAVLVGSGLKTREVVADAALMAQLKLDPGRQLIGAQCSGSLVLSRLGLLDAIPACTDLTTRPWLRDAGVEVLDRPFFATGNIATSGAAWPLSTSPVGSSLAWLASMLPARQCTILRQLVRRPNTLSGCRPMSGLVWAREVRRKVG